MWPSVTICLNCTAWPAGSRWRQSAGAPPNGPGPWPNSTGQGRGNSGVFYRGTRQYDHIYWSAPEYQLLDDANAPDGANRLTSTAADYALYAAPAGVVKPFGEWNRARIVVRGADVEHWLNGRRVVHYKLGSADWRARVAGSKFRQFPAYGKASRGLLGLQGDHQGELAFRHMRIRSFASRN